MTARRMYALVNLWLFIVPGALSFAGNAFFGMAGGAVGLVVGLVPGIWGYFVWIRLSGLGARPERRAVYAESHVGDNF